MSERESLGAGDILGMKWAQELPLKIIFQGENWALQEVKQEAKGGFPMHLCLTYVVANTTDL